MINDHCMPDFNACMVGCSWRNRYWIALICLVLYYILYQSKEFYPNITYQIDASQSIPLILLYTFNHSKKTRDSICRGIRNGGSAVTFDGCPYKCQFSCRMEDFHGHSTLAVLFFGEDFYWPFKLTDANRTSHKQKWIFWSWEAPINHPEYLKSGLSFNWFVLFIEYLRSNQDHISTID